MKRVFAIVIIMTMVTTLFAFPGFATTYNPTTYNSYTDAITISNVTYDLRVTQFKALSEGTSMLPGGMETIMFVQFQLVNRNNQDALCQIPVFSIDLSDERVITDVFTYAGDLALGVISTGFVIYPTQAFSYNASNKIVVPSNSTLTLVGGIGLPAQLNQTGDGTLDTGLRNVHLLNKPYSVSLGSYAHGIPVDLSPINSFLNDIIDNQDDIALSLSDIVNILTYSGNTYSESATNAAYVLVSDEIAITNVSTRLGRVIGRSYVLDRDFELNNTSDTNVSAATYVIPVYYWYTIVNDTDNTLRLPGIIAINNGLPSGSYSIEINHIDTMDFYDLHMNPGDVSSATYRRLYFSINNADSDYSYIPAHSRVCISFSMNVYCSDPTLVTWHGITSRFTVTPSLRTSTGRPTNIFELLYELYKSLTKAEADDNTEEAQDMNDEIHEQEQTWYDNNSEALENVGLSNYRFSQSQSSGITQAVTQFQAVWNALGSWTNVYIFILILSISTYIIRHEPTTRVKQYRSSVQAERAERISYYGRKNAESRASASSGSTLKNAIRRRK